MSKIKSSYLQLTALDDRLVPSATILDLTTTDAEATANGAIVRQVDAQPTGTGFIHSFVRLQGAASGGGSQQGYNTSARPLQFDENNSPVFTRDLKLSAVPVVTVGGTQYREFLLDINQKASSPRLSLDELRIYLGSSGGLTGYNSSTKELAGMTASFDLDAAGDVSVLLNARLNSGSGAGDMILLVPNDAFSASDPDTRVYLYSRMGTTPGATANGGFEEWAVRKGGGSTTPTGEASISGRVFMDFNQNGFLDSDSDYVFSGVTITLQGTNDLGETVVLTATTNEEGHYSFTGLRAGTYSLIETNPFVDGTLIDGLDYVGSLGGALSGTDGIVNIDVASGAIGTGYDFTEIVPSIG